MSDKFPKLVVGAYIFNKKGELFLLKSSHWGDLYAAPGGEVNYGEAVEDAVVRQIKEKTGLQIQNLNFIANAEVVHPEQRVDSDVHLVSLRYRAEIKNDTGILDDIEFMWLKPEEVVGHGEVREGVKDFVKKYLVEKKKIFSKKCKDCDDNLRESEEYKQGWQRAQADYKNLQKEILDQRGEWARMSEQQILEEFIPVYDNFKKAFAMEHGEENGKWENWAKGIEYIMKQFGKILEDHSVVEIRTEGELFNPELHEAMGEEDSEEDAGRILREVDGGYKMKDKVIKVAKVIVAK
ncbi:nucleotide exchange factor GrpE [Candidatus Parcubacteria bacterium]|nr:MAG: nucleotide exchange factor GrpE [Candidatus Parcubacteria bacterium]